jgi:putative ABC transport system permease protein
VVAVGLTNVLPASGFWGGAAYTIEGAPVDHWKLQFSMFTITYGDFFRTMRIRLLEGRTFTANDRADAPLVVIVNQSMAKHCWPGGSPIGKRMHVGNPKKGLPWATVVGVVADTKLGSRDEPGGDQWYAPEEQPAILFGTPDVGKGNVADGRTRTEIADGYIAVRSTVPVEAMTQVMRLTVAGIDPQLALENVQAMDGVISDVEAPRRFNTGLITAFAMGALLLALTGIYAVVAFSVSLRTQEIAIRMALGAQRRGIARLVLISGAKLAVLGCGLGLLGSLAVSRMVSSFLFGVSATDPLVYAAATLTMITMAVLASVLPAVRAASADPIQALRSI